jgi:tetratricopeptide (TPR) repeat protein
MRLGSRHIPNLILIATFAFFGLTSLLPISSMWGFNHLEFAPSIFTYLYIIIFVLFLWILFAPLPESRLQNILTNTDNWLFGNRTLPRLIVTINFTLLFFILESHIFLLGDGYAWLSNLGSGQAYIHKWSEPLSIFLIRQIQLLLGGYTYDTALTAFRFLSILSGAIFIYNILAIIKRLTDNTYIRLISLATFLFSGAILLFFGYVEFYPMVWAATALLINLSIQNLNKKYPLWPIIILYVLSVLLHLQMLCLLPGIYSLSLQNITSIKIRKIGYVLMAAGAAAGIAGIIYLYNTHIEFEVLLLPFLKPRPVAPGYTFLSPIHLYDLANLILLVFPGIAILLFVWYIYGAIRAKNPTSMFLIFLSIGSLSFTLLYGAAITMARDWDIMSLGLLPPILLLLYQIARGKNFQNIRLTAAYTLVVGFITISFLTVALGQNSSENRFRTFLNNRNANVWLVYADYLHDKGDFARSNEYIRRRYEVFPDLKKLEQAHADIKQGDYTEALSLARQLVNNDPYNPDFLQILGNAYYMLGQYDKSQPYYDKALRLKPYNFAILNETGLLYLKLNKYNQAIPYFNKAHNLAPDSIDIIEGLAMAYILKNDYAQALAWADSMFQIDADSPGASLIKLTIAGRKSDNQTARKYYFDFLKYGKGRSDYERIRKYYHNLE